MTTLPPGIPLVSIIIPCHNAETFLQETIESALCQTHHEIEIILVDDGSTDGTPATIDSFGDRVRSVHGPNQGAACARNTGTALAKGEFLLYLDADDLLTPAAVSSRVEALCTSGADVAYADWQRLEEIHPGHFQPGKLFARRMEDVHPRPEIALITSFWCPPAAILYRRTLVERIGGWKQRIAPIEDARFFLDAALVGGSFIHVPGVTARYRVAFGLSHSRRSPAAFMGAVFRSASEVEAHWLALGPLDQEQKKALLSVYEHCARAFFRRDSGSFKRALHAIYQLEPRFQPTWPKVADFLERFAGHESTLFILKAMGRPAQ